MSSHTELVLVYAANRFDDWTYSQRPTKTKTRPRPFMLREWNDSVMNNEEQDELVLTLNGFDDDESALNYINLHPLVANATLDLGTGSESRALSRLARSGFVRSVAKMIELGADVDYEGDSECALFYAMLEAHVDVARILLEAGADPNKQRYLVTCINCEDADHPERVELIKLLVASGCRVNNLFAMFGDKKNARTALDFVSAGSPMHAFLRSIGAKTAKEVLAENPKAPISDE